MTGSGPYVDVGYWAEYLKKSQELHSYLKSSPAVLREVCFSDKYKNNWVYVSFLI